MPQVNLYNGVPLEDLTKEELIEAVIVMAGLYSKELQQHGQTLKLLGPLTIKESING